MLVDFFIVLMAYAAALFLSVTAVRAVWHALRRRPKAHVPDTTALFPKIDRLLKYGENGAQLSVTPHMPGASRQHFETLNLVKYITPDGRHGLECIFPWTLGARKFSRLSLQFHQYTSWPVLEAFAAEHEIAISEFTSPPDSHWTDSYFLFRLDLGRNPQAAAAFVAFYFGRMLEMPSAPFAWKLDGVSLVRRLTGCPITTLSPAEAEDVIARQVELKPWRRKRTKPAGELRDLHLIVVRMLGIAGLCYSLGLASPAWRAVRLTLFGADIAIRSFDLVFISFFVFGVFGEVILGRAKRVRFPVVAMVTIALIQASHRIMCSALRLELVVLSRQAALFSSEKKGFYGLFLSTFLPSRDSLRSAARAVTVIGTLSCLVVIYRWRA